MPALNCDPSNRTPPNICKAFRFLLHTTSGRRLATPALNVLHTFSPRARQSDAVSDNVCQASMATTLGVVLQEVGRSGLLIR